MSKLTSAGPLTIEKILSPLSVDEFCRDYLGKKAVHLPGRAEDVAHLITREGVLEICANPKADVFAGIVAPTGGFSQLQIKNGHAPHMYANGWSLQVEELHLLEPKFMELATLIRDQVGLFSGMEAGVMLATEGRGYPMHTDPNPNVWIFQIFGRKKWTYAKRPCVDRPLEYSIMPRGDRLPPSNSPYYDMGPRLGPDDVAEVVLEPGDVFYFPGGTWHAAQALDECCHVIIADTNTTWADVLMPAIRDRLLPRAEWRQVPEDHGADRAALKAALMARLDDIKQVIDGLSPDEAWQIVEDGLAERRKGAYRQR